MGTHRLSVHVAALPERVFGLWTDLGRMKDWVGGVTRVTGRIFAMGSHPGSMMVRRRYGATLGFTWNTLSGSQVRFRAARRASFASP
jgi:uncharacterized protein YndB with AHSA1/START domain